MMYNQDVIAVRGGGDLATGVVQKLWRCGLKEKFCQIRAISGAEVVFYS